MNRIVSPSVKTTKNFILIKIPRNFMTAPFSSEKISELERGLRESFEEASAGKLIGPFKNSRDFLRALKKPA